MVLETFAIVGVFRLGGGGSFDEAINESGIVHPRNRVSRSTSGGSVRKPKKIHSSMLSSLRYRGTQFSHASGALSEARELLFMRLRVRVMMVREPGPYLTTACRPGP